MVRTRSGKVNGDGKAVAVAVGVAVAVAVAVGVTVAVAVGDGVIDGVGVGVPQFPAVVLMVIAHPVAMLPMSIAASSTT
jgi:hypothetical protein